MKIFNNIQLDKSVIVVENIQSHLTGRIGVCQVERNGPLEESGTLGQGIRNRPANRIEMSRSVSETVWSA